MAPAAAFGAFNGTAVKAQQLCAAFRPPDDAAAGKRSPNAEPVEAATVGNRRAYFNFKRSMRPCPSSRVKRRAADRKPRPAPQVVVLRRTRPKRKNNKKQT